LVELVHIDEIHFRMRTGLIDCCTSQTAKEQQQQQQPERNDYNNSDLIFALFFGIGCLFRKSKKTKKTTKRGESSVRSPLRMPWLSTVRGAASPIPYRSKVRSSRITKWIRLVLRLLRLLLW
jgi:hypothetical protein